MPGLDSGLVRDGISLGMVICGAWVGFKIGTKVGVIITCDEDGPGRDSFFAPHKVYILKLAPGSLSFCHGNMICLLDLSKESIEDDGQMGMAEHQEIVYEMKRSLFPWNWNVEGV